MRIVFMGTPDFAVPPLEALLEDGHEVSAVISQPDKPVGRKMELRPTAVKAAAQRAGVPVLQPERIRDVSVMEELRRLAPELIIVIAYGQILPEEILNLPEYGCLNVHASLLPAYRGAAPIQWAVINGEAISGVTIMQMEKGLDTGAILAQREIPLSEDETGGSLFDRLSKEGAELLAETVRKLPEGSLVPRKQPAESPTPYARMLTKADGILSFSQSARQLECRIRGLNPWPSAMTVLHGKKLKIWKASVIETEAADSVSESVPAEPGTVIASGREGILVQTGSGRLLLTEVQPEGKKRMQASDFLRGHAVLPGDRLG